MVHWDGLEGDDELDRVVTSSQREFVEDRGQPWVEIVGKATPFVSVKFGRFKAGRWWWSRLGVGQAVGRGGEDWSGCSSVGVEDLLGLFVGEFELGAVILEEIQVVSHG